MAWEIDQKDIRVQGNEYHVSWICKDTDINGRKGGKFTHIPDGADSHDTIMAAIDTKINADEGVFPV